MSVTNFDLLDMRGQQYESFGCFWELLSSVAPSCRTVL